MSSLFPDELSDPDPLRRSSATPASTAPGPSVSYPPRVLPTDYQDTEARPSSADSSEALEMIPLRVGEFVLVRREPVADIDGEALLYENESLGTQVLFLRNADPVLSACLGFYTPPQNSRGVEHVFEHDAFRGSPKYPSQEPVLEYERGSAQLDGNAATYADYTVYYFSTPMRVDFEGLLDCYLDAVYHSLNRPESFAQERGCLQRITDKDGKTEIKFTGIVFSEMKGYFAQPDTIHDVTVVRELFRNTHLQHYSGGLPLEIMRLSHEEILRHREQRQIASNSRHAFGGPVPIRETLEAILESVSGHTRTDCQIPPVEGPDFTGTRRVDAEYPGLPGENRARDSIVSVSWALGSRQDPARNLRLAILGDLLLFEDYGVLQSVLIESGLGDDVIDDGLNSDLAQLRFTAGLRGANAKEAEQIRELIESSMRQAIERGFDCEAISAAIHSHRLANAALRNQKSRGAAHLEQVMQEWFQHGDPVHPLRELEILDALEADLRAGKRVFEELLAEILKAPSLLLTMTPSSTLLEEQRREEDRTTHEQIAALGEELETALDEAAALPDKLAKLDTTRALRRIPRLNITHFRRRAEHIPVLSSPEDERVSMIDLPTNSLAYLNVSFDLGAVPSELLPYVGIVAPMLFYTGTPETEPEAFMARLGCVSSGIEYEQRLLPHRSRSSAAELLTYSTYCFSNNIRAAAQLMAEGMSSPVFDDREGTIDILRERISTLEEGLRSEESELVAQYASSRASAAGSFADLMGGIQHLRFLRTVEREARRGSWLKVRSALEETHHFMRKGQNPRAYVVCGEDNFRAATQELSAALNMLHLEGGTPRAAPIPEKAEAVGITIASPMNFVGYAVPLAQTGWKFHGSAIAIGYHLHTTHLWHRIRRLGRAYGQQFETSELSRVLTLRSNFDPRPHETIETFRRLPEFIEELAEEQSEIRRSTIRALAELDAPSDPADHGRSLFYDSVSGAAAETLQQERDEVFATTGDHYRAFAEVVREGQKQAALAVLGSEQSLADLQRLGDLTRVEDL